MTIDEASFVILGQLMEIAANEGRMPCITGIHSIVSIGDGTASVYVDLDDPNANEGMGIVIVHVNESAMSGMDHADILQALTGYGHTIH